MNKTYRRYARGVKPGTVREPYKKRQNTFEFTSSARAAALKLWAQGGINKITKKSLAAELNAGVSTINYHVGCLTNLLAQAKAEALAHPEDNLIVVGSLLANRDADALKAIQNPILRSRCFVALFHDICGSN